MRHLFTLMAAWAFTLGLTAQQVTYYTTKADGTLQLARTVGNTSTSGSNANVMTLLPSQQYQSMDGFGFAITYSSCYNLLKMSKADRAALLRRTYSTTQGYGVSYARISIGCNDFSSTEYTLCDNAGLENFALQSDETNYVIPILKEILAINPDVKIIATPWTCPKWMKVSDLTTLGAHNAWTDGHLNPNYRQTYAEYFVKFIEAMRTQGIGIYAVCPQNEPLNKANCASLYMPWQEEAEFLKYLAPAIKNAGLSTKIYVYDHNYNYDNVSDQNDYPVKVYDVLSGSTFVGSELIVGAAYHNYGGSSDELNDIHDQAPDKEVIFSEESIGTWNNGRDLKSALIDKMKSVVLGTVNKWCRAALVWNFMLDDQRGPNLDGGCQTCYGAIDINSDNYKTLLFNSHYYVISHMSSVVQPGAVRINTSGGTLSNTDYSAFRNPDGSYAVVFASSSDATQSLAITDGSRYATVTVPANSIVSVLMGKDTDAGLLSITLGGQAMTPAADDNSVYSLTTTLTNGQRYTASGSEVFAEEDFFCDPDYFEKNADGTFTFLGLTGSYTVKTDLRKKSFRVWAMSGNSPATLNSDGTGAVWLIGTAGTNKPTWAAANSSWVTGTDAALCLVPIAEKKYQITLTVGKQLSKDDVDFKFFGQAGWGTEFKGSSDTYHLSTASDIFGIGTGTGIGGNGHDDGNIYLKDGQTLTDGDTYVFTIDLTGGTQNGILTIERTVYEGIWVIGAAGSIGTPRYETEGTTATLNDWSKNGHVNSSRLTKTDDSHYYIDLTVGQQLNKDHVDFKFFGQDGWGTEYKGTAATYHLSTTSEVFGIGNGTDGHDDGNIYLKDGQTLTDGDIYRFSIDLTGGTSQGVLTIEQLDREADYSGIWIIGANSSIGTDHYVEKDSETQEWDWDWNTERAIALTKVDDTHYTIDLTVGQQLNKDVVNFKFFGQAGWGIEFNTTGTHQISSVSSLFGIGNGSDGHDDGNIYLKSGQTLTDGDAYRLTIDATDPYNVVLSSTLLAYISIPALPAGMAPGQPYLNIRTYSSDKAYYRPEGMDVYVVERYADGKAYMRAIDYLPANTGLIIASNTATTFKVVPYADPTATYAGSNLLVPTVTPTLIETSVSVGGVISKRNYMFAYHRDSTSDPFDLGFYRAKTGTSGANRAYLSLDADDSDDFTRRVDDSGLEGAASKPIFMEYGTTGIARQAVRPATADNAFYTLQGIRVSQPKRPGLYIRNGKKTIIR